MSQLTPILEDESLPNEIYDEIEKIKRSEGILLGASQNKLLVIEDVVFLINTITTEHIVDLYPLMMTLRTQIMLGDDLIPLFNDLHLQVRYNDDVNVLIKIFDSPKITNDQRINIRKYIKGIENKCNETLSSEQKVIQQYLRVMKSEAERRILSKLYETVKFITTYKLDKKDVIIKLVDVIMRILSDKSIVDT